MKVVKLVELDPGTGVKTSVGLGTPIGKLNQLGFMLEKIDNRETLGQVRSDKGRNRPGLEMANVGT